MSDLLFRANSGLRDLNELINFFAASLGAMCCCSWLGYGLKSRSAGAWLVG